MTAASSAERYQRLYHETRERIGALRQKVVWIANGWDSRAFPVAPSRPLPASGPLTLAYFGTIDAWLDFRSLEDVVRTCPEVTVRLIGPNACGYAPPDPRIVVRHPVPHATLATAVEDCDAFLLPFQVNDLTRAVDPVKLYEYIALGRPVLCSHWAGLDRFRAMVTFYETTSQFVHLFAARALTAPLDASTRAAFLAQHAWSARVGSMAAALKAVDSA